MDQNWAISFVRTIVAPLIVGGIGQLVLFLWSDDVSMTLRAISTVLIGAVWYTVARLAQLSNPQFGFLLIIAATPRYNEEDRDSELLISIVRTTVPYAFATVIGWLIATFVGGSTLALCLAAVLVYYGTLRWVEEKSAPDSIARYVAGVMLGAPVVPHY